MPAPIKKEPAGVTELSNNESKLTVIKECGVIASTALITVRSPDEPEFGL